MEEVILGAFGIKINVDVQIAHQWKELGMDFSQAWGFSDVYDFESSDYAMIWETIPGIGKDADDFVTDDMFVTPPAKVLTLYTEEDRDLMKEAAEDFLNPEFLGVDIDEFLDKCEMPTGRVPMGLLTMCGHGISNAILEIDLSLETFDYGKKPFRFTIEELLVP